MPKNGSKRSNGGTRNGRGGAQVVQALKTSEVWDRQLAKKKDACRVSDRCSIYLFGGTPASGNLTGTPQPLQPIVLSSGVNAPGPFGQRVFDIAQCYERYRINRLLAVYRPIVGTQSAGLTALGFIDDPDPTTIEGGYSGLFSLRALRCAHEDSVYQDIEVEWRPIDKTAWYFVDPAQAVQSGADYRLETPVAFVQSGAYLGFTAATTIGLTSLYYDITFEGATPVLQNGS